MKSGTSMEFFFSSCMFEEQIQYYENAKTKIIAKRDHMHVHLYLYPVHASDGIIKGVDKVAM